MSWSSFIRKSSGELTILVDIGSGSVAAALAVFSKGQKPKVILSKRSHIILDDNWDKEKVFSSLIKTLNNVLNSILREGASILHIQEKKLRNRKIKEIFCTLSSPWSAFEVRTIESQKEKPEHVSTESIKKIIENDLKDLAAGSAELELIEKKVIQIKLNGYSTSNPFGKKARKTEISIFEGLVKKEIMEEIKKTVSRVIHGGITFHSLSLATFIAISEIFEEYKDYLIVDITGETTELILVNEEVPKVSFSFPAGRNNFIRNIAREFQVNQEVALSFINLYYDRKSEINFRKKLEEKIKQTEKEWLLNLGKNLENIKKVKPIFRVFLVVDQQLSRPFPELIKLACQKTFKNIELTPLTGQGLSQFCNFQGNYDPFLAIEAVSVNKIKNS